jgi:hypothetical protein
MITFSMKLTKAELELVEAISWLQYGSLYDLELLDEEEIEIKEISKQQKELIGAIRDGWRDIATVVVHQGEPSYMECRGLTPQKITCTKRFKFM